MNLHPIQLSRLQFLETGQFIIRYITDFNGLGLNPAEDSVFLDLHNSLLTQSPIYNLALAQIQAKAESDKLQKQDNKRDKQLTTLRRALSVYEHSENPQEKEAYNRIKIVVNKYKNLEIRNFEAQSLGIDNLIADLRSEINLLLAQTLSMVPHIDNLEAINTIFKTTFNTRSSNSIIGTTYDTKALRAEILATYKDLAEYVFVMAKRKNTTYYNSILSAMNNGREYYSIILTRRKGNLNQIPEMVGA